MRHLAVLSCILLLSGCMSALQQLKSADPQANDFSGALSAEYLAYADSQQDEGRPKVAEHFAAKGKKALAGEAVMPEEASRALPPEAYKKQAEYREMLMLFLTDDMKSVAAQKLARAQLLFDCWQQQSEQPGSEIAPCAEEFESVMEELRAVAETFIQGDEAIHYLQFSQKSAMLSEQSVQIINEIANRISGMARYTVVLEAFPNPDSVSQRVLSEKRLSEVRAAFIGKGVPESRIEIEKMQTDKAVRLSHDDAEQHRNSVKVVATGFGQPGDE